MAILVLTAFGCSSPAAQVGSSSTSSPGVSSVTTSPSTTSTTSTTATHARTCSLALTRDPYDGFHIGVPGGWDVFTLDDEIVVSRDPTDTEEVVVRPALMTLGLTPAAFFTASLSAVKRQVTSSGGSMTVTTTASLGVPTASLTLRASQVLMDGQAQVEILPDQTAHGSSLLVFMASWAPVARFAADRTLLADIGTCYGTQPATLYRVIKDQVFTYAIPPGWSVTSEGQDTIDIADGSDASASYTLTLVPPGSGVDSAQTLLNWAFRKLGIQISQVLTSVHLPDQTTSTGAIEGQLYDEFTGKLSDGRAIHGLVQLVSVTGAGITSGVIRLGVSTAALWNSVNGALVHIMSSIQHDFAQDLQQWESLSQQWQAFDQQVQGFDDALSGVDLVHDPTTGATFEAPYDAYSETGRDGPGYYDPAGNKLEIQTP